MRSPPSSPSPPSVFGTLGRALADLVLPAECAVCAAPGHRLCPACAEGLTAVLSRPFRAEQDAPALPLGPGGAPLPVMAAGRYADPLAAAVLAFKDHHALHLRGVLGEALCRAVAAARLEPDLPGCLLYTSPSPRDRG